MKKTTNGFLLNRRLSFKAHKTYIIANSLKHTKNIRSTFEATAYAGDKAKMHSICSTPVVLERREIFAMGLKLNLHHYQVRFSKLVRQQQLEKC